MNRRDEDHMWKIARSLVRDFLGGVDPTGGSTFRYGMEDVEKGRKRTGIRRAVGTAGGVVGGAVAVPAAVGGLIEGVKGFARGKGLGGRLLGAGRGLVSGAVKPYSQVYHATRASRALKAMQAGKRLSPEQMRHLHAAGRRLGGESVGALVPKATRAGKSVSRKAEQAVQKAEQLAERAPVAATQAEKAVGRVKPVAEMAGYGGQATATEELARQLSKARPDMMKFREAVEQVGPEVARRMQSQASSKLMTGLSTLGTSGVIGGGSAYLQYGKGQQAAQRYRRQGLVPRE